MLELVRLDPPSAARHRDGLAELLVDAVESGASVGFLPPLALDDARAYWRDVERGITDGSRVLLAALDEGRVEGSVQLGLELRANGDHRAEAMKLFVHRRARRRGLARALVTEAERTARALGRTLLTMDTRQGGDAERLCVALGWRKYGELPRYARSADGTLHTTCFYFRELGSGAS